MPALLALIPSKYIYVCVLVALAVSTGLFIVHEHTNHVIAERNAAIVAEQNKRIVAALQEQIADAEKRAARAGQIKGQINAAQNSKACAGSAPVRAALDGLRDSAGSRPAPGRAH
jgi:hypothetical protein